MSFKDMLDLLHTANADALFILILLVFTVSLTLRKSTIDNKYLPVFEAIAGIGGGMLVYLAYPDDAFPNIFLPIIDGIIVALIDNVGNKLYDLFKH